MRQVLLLKLVSGERSDRKLELTQGTETDNSTRGVPHGSRFSEPWVFPLSRQYCLFLALLLH